MGDHALIRDEATGRVDTIEPAVGQLIRRLIENDARPGSVDEADEIILDIEVDGVRYLAIRCATRSAAEAEQARGLDSVAAQARGGHTLSPRELEIARMVAKGYANKSIASVLDISSWTVSSHLRRIFSKLGVTSRAAMVAQLLDEERSPGASPLQRSRLPVTGPAPKEPVRPVIDSRAGTIQVVTEGDARRAELRRPRDGPEPAFARGDLPAPTGTQALDARTDQS